MAKKKSGVYICRRAFICQIRGQKYSVPTNAIVPNDVGYEVLEGHEDNFEQLVEQATAAPGEKRSVSMPKSKSAEPAKSSEEEDDK